VETLLVTLPDAATLSAADNACNCPGSGADLGNGFPVRGKVVAISSDRGVVRLQHAAIPGLLRRGEDEFSGAPELIAAVKPGQEVLARIEVRGDAWWIFDVRRLLAK
jgi:hypothetical protein